MPSGCMMVGKHRCSPWPLPRPVHPKALPLPTRPTFGGWTRDTIAGVSVSTTHSHGLSCPLTSGRGPGPPHGERWAARGLTRKEAGTGTRGVIQLTIALCPAKGSFVGQASPLGKKFKRCCRLGGGRETARRVLHCFLTCDGKGSHFIEMTFCAHHFFAHCTIRDTEGIWTV